MLDAIKAIMMTTGMFKTNEAIVAVTRSAPGNALRAKNTPHARVAPTGAENTALKTIASNAEASRTRPVLFRRNNCPPSATDVDVVDTTRPLLPRDTDSRTPRSEATDRYRLLGYLARPYPLTLQTARIACLARSGSAWSAWPKGCSSSAQGGGSIVNVLEKLFGEQKPLIAMCHLLGLPGRPTHNAAAGVQGIAEALAPDVEALQSAGVDGLLFCNEHD